MNRATPPLREFAGRLIHHEAGSRTSDPDAPAAFAVLERLGTPITTLMGSGGHRALLLRALTLAAAEAPWLRDVQVTIDGTLKGPAPSGGSDDQDRMIEGGVVLVAQLIGLLVAFIGERLTLHLIHEIWPHFPAEDLHFTI